MTLLGRGTGRVLWHQLSETLAAEIAAGTPPPGSRLPAEAALMTRFGVSRFTVRQALGHLVTRGLVRAEQGRGTFVEERVLTYAISGRTRFSRNLIEQGFEPGGALLLHEEIAAEPLVAERLKLPPYSRVIHRRGVMTADGMPVELGDSYYPAARFPDFAAARERHATISAALASYGITDYRRLSTDVDARMPTPEEARLLRQSAGIPVLLVQKVDVDTVGTPICLSVSLWASERVTFALETG